jgi:hypothetical protein
MGRNGTQDRIEYHSTEDDARQRLSRARRISMSMASGERYGWIKPVAFAIAVAGGVWAAASQFADKASQAQVERVDSKVGQVRDDVKDLTIEVKVMQTEQRMLIRAIRPDLGKSLGRE